MVRKNALMTMVARLLALACLALASREAYAHPVAVDPGAYTGQWAAPGGSYVSGAQIVDLPTGTSFIAVGSAGAFAVSVDGGGNVTVVNGLSAVGGPGSLLFNTVSVVVDPADFDGQWTISRGVPGTFTTGVQTATFVPGIAFNVAVGSAGNFTVTADASGDVSVQNGVSAVGGPGSLLFNTVPVVVDPADFDGQWTISRGEPGTFTTGVQTATFVPGIAFNVAVGSAGNFTATADASGDVSVQNGVSAVGGPGSLLFNTVSATVDPAEYAGEWAISRGEPGTFVTGVQTATFVPGVAYSVAVGGAGGFFVTPDAFGSIHVTNGVSAVGGASSLTFSSFAITVDPGAFAGSWNLARATLSATGPRTANLVPGVAYALQASGAGNQFITVSSPCGVSPATFVLGGFDFTADCGCSDQDEDGVCDAVDACPADPMNDADADGVCADADVCSGDDASGDSDADLFCDDVDPCFGLNTTGDSDLDGVCNDQDSCSGQDATGDADADGICDSDDQCDGDDASGDADGDLVCDDSDICSGADSSGDADGDGTCDDSDTCPLDALNDEDSDGVCGNVDVCAGDDATGDVDADQVCDDEDICAGNDVTGDADADGTCDDLDNCPTDSNEDQADADGDAIGDMCESDADSDGIIDDLDNCPTAVNADQSDVDLDDEGDACDLDDDADGVVDVADNCPLYANSTQSDFDVDGFGDVCDGDDDADGVSDDIDACEGTPIGSLFDDHGCSGEQRVELACGLPGESPRGRYIACVVRESKKAQRLGLLTRQERAQLIRQAVRGDVCRPRNRRW